MRERLDIDEAIKGWSFQPETIMARLVNGSDGRDVLQMRIEMGVLQMEVESRPDGARPGGAETYLAYLRQKEAEDGESFAMTEEECREVDREFMQYYHRRICWMALRDYVRATADADHTLAMMDCASAHAPVAKWAEEHEQYRPFVLFHRTQAASLALLDEGGPEEALRVLDQGMETIEQTYAEVEDREEDFLEGMLSQLVELKDWIREHYGVVRTLHEQLDHAIESEDYEAAAKLRDEIAQRKVPGI